MPIGNANHQLRGGSRVWSPLRMSPAASLAALLVLTVLVTLLAPQPVEDEHGGPTSRSTRGGGTRMFYELAQRMGWRASERLEKFDWPNGTRATTAVPTASVSNGSVSTASPVTGNTLRAVQIVLSPQGGLGDNEVHQLLENARAGGGLLFDVEGNDELADSLGIFLGAERREAPLVTDADCRSAGRIADRTRLLFPPPAHEMLWRRPPPGLVSTIGDGMRSPGSSSASFAVGFRMGAGRVVAVGSSEILTNDMVRHCGWGADIVAVRALEYLRPSSAASAPSLVFDEYHHGYGVRDGSVTAITMYLSRTPSGRFLAQALLAGLVMLLAMTARPTPPRDTSQLPRRSPLEHADALANAYVDVDATKTGAERLLSGLRRRAGRMVPVPSRVDDAAFLAAVVARAPTLASHVNIVTKALASTTTPREFLAVGEAIREIERRLMTSPAHRK